MADISAIKLPNGTAYNLKDTTARSVANSAVPNSRTINGKALSSNISLGAGDVGAYTKKEIDTKISDAIASAYKYKGSVTADKLPTSGQVVGDVYNITNDSSYGKAGMNVAWDGTTWDALGSNVDLSNYVTTSDSRLSNARPASDVYAWAKAATKPSYSASEIGAAPASHTHNKVQDIGNNADITFAYSKAGMTGNPSWLAAWNGYELRAIAPNQITTGSAGSVAWSNVSDRPTNLNQFTNGPGYITASGNTWRPEASSGQISSMLSSLGL